MNYMRWKWLPWVWMCLLDDVMLVSDFRGGVRAHGLGFGQSQRKRPCQPARSRKDSHRQAGSPAAPWPEESGENQATGSKIHGLEKAGQSPGWNVIKGESRIKGDVLHQTPLASTKREESMRTARLERGVHRCGLSALVIAKSVSRKY